MVRATPLSRHLYLAACVLAFGVSGCGDDKGTATGTELGASERLTIEDVVFDRDGVAHVLLLRQDGRVVMLPLGYCGSDLIYNKLYDIPLPRPITYDLFKTMAESLSVSLPRVMLDVAAGDSLTASIALLGSAGSSQTPALVTDALGIAQRMEAPIMASAELLSLHTLGAEPPQPEPPASPKAVQRLDAPKSVAKAGEDPPALLSTPVESLQDPMAMIVLGVLRNLFGGATVVLLDEARTTALTIIVGSCSGLAIFMAFEKLDGTELLPHALLQSLAVSGGGEVQYVRVTELQGSTFIAEIGISQGADVMAIDARPSDAVALALLAGSPIQVAQHVLNELGEDPARYLDLLEPVAE